ncbi:hypothetical protein [Ignavibacterium sp.]|uniref:hypothetical protein n=1 Tax=Ignavibacterium sp. TaxID=2651167 RepID=UPI00307DE0F1
MKKIIKYFSLIILLILVSCKENSVVNPPSGNLDFFPAKAEAKYSFNFYYVLNPGLNGTKFISIGNLNNINGTEYFAETDSSIFERTITVDTTFFRKSKTGVFYFIDTTGVSEFIPDSIRNSLSIDTESRLLFFPLTINQTWPVYQVDVTFSGVPVYSIIKISAKVIDSYLLTKTFRDSSITKLVNKIQYDMDVQLSPTSPKETFTAFGYTMDGIGFIKWEGDTLVLDLIRGGRLNFTGTITSSTVVEELTNYFIP